VLKTRISIIFYDVSHTSFVRSDNSCKIIYFFSEKLTKE